jgi:Peptidase family M48
MAWPSSAIFLIASILLSACAGPQLHVPKAPQYSVDIERQRQLASLHDQKDIAFRQKIDQWRRVYEIYSRLRTRGADICGTQTSPFWGVWLGDSNSFSGEDAERGKRLLKLGPEITILAVAANGQAAGLRAGDVITRIGNTVLKQHATRQKSQLTIAAEALKKLGEGPADIEFERENTKYTTQLRAEAGCRYRLNLTEDKELNASSTGEAINLPFSMIQFADDDEKLAHVIAHEIAHNVLGHLDRRKTNAAVGQIIGAVIDIGLLVGARVDTGGAFGRLGASAGATAYSHEFERESDYMSLYFMVRAGFDPLKARDFWRDVSKAEPILILENYRSLHPSNPERAANIEVAVQQITGQIARNEPLLPLTLKDSPTQDAIVLVDAPNILQRQVMTLREQQALLTPSAAKPVVIEGTPKPTRHHAVLLHTKGRLVSTPPMTLNAEYFDNGSGAGTSRLIFPGNQIWEGEFRLLPTQQSFKGMFNPRLLDPDKISPAASSVQKGFATYVGPSGSVMECGFMMSNSGQIDRGRCVDERGNEYQISF